MSDRFKASISALAKHSIHMTMMGGGHPERTDYPDISEHDWQVVLKVIRQRTYEPTPAAVSLAYDFLARRADHE